LETQLLSTSQFGAQEKFVRLLRLDSHRLKLESSRESIKVILQGEKKFIRFNVQNKWDKCMFRITEKRKGKPLNVLFETKNGRVVICDDERFHDLFWDNIDFDGSFIEVSLVIRLFAELVSQNGIDPMAKTDHLYGLGKPTCIEAVACKGIYPFLSEAKVGYVPAMKNKIQSLSIYGLIEPLVSLIIIYAEDPEWGSLKVAVVEQAMTNIPAANTRTQEF
jgi:hypothetical protein